MRPLAALIIFGEGLKIRRLVTVPFPLTKSHGRLDTPAVNETNTLLYRLLFASPTIDINVSVFSQQVYLERLFGRKYGTMQKNVCQMKGERYAVSFFGDEIQLQHALLLSSS